MNDNTVKQGNIEEVKKGSKIVVSEENIEEIEESLDYALGDCHGAPSHLIAEIVLKVLDEAEKKGRLNPTERRIACDYITASYGYNF